MKSRVPIVLAVLVAVLVVGGVAFRFAGGGGAAPIPAAFANGMTVEQAISRGTESGKPVLIYATADWCGPCQRFKKGPLSDAKVASFITQNFEAVYLDVDHHPDLASKLEVETIPAMRVLRPGKPPVKLNEYMEADRLVAWLESTLKA